MPTKLLLSLVAIALLSLGWTFAPLTLTPDTLQLARLPEASPPAEMSISTLPTALMDSSAAFAVRGGSFTDARLFSQTALLVHHPRGDLLFDTGLGEHAREHFAHAPWLMRNFAKLSIQRTAAAQLRAAGYDLTSLAGIVPTHVHWDHISGIPDFPAVPVWLNDSERAFVNTGGDASEIMRSFGKLETHAYAFEARPYLGFARSFDVWGDGSIVLVPAPGHTPGSMLAFITLPSGKRLALLGDLVWQTDGVTRPAERPWITRVLVDADAGGVRAAISHVAALHTRFPELDFLPAHDARAWSKLPVFPARWN